MINIVGNYVNIPEVELITQPQANKLLFVGKMSYDPNIIAVEYFVNEIFPSIKEHIPSTSFTVVGANPTYRVKKLTNGRDIFVTGFVDDITSYFKEASILVAPMLTGAGIQNKLIQGMSYGCCVATSPIGAEGLEVTDEIAIYNTTEDWISGLVGLLSNPEKRIEMGLKAHNYVKEHLSFQQIQREFKDFID